MAEDVIVENQSPNIAGQDRLRDERVKSYVMEQVQSVLAARRPLEDMWIVMDRIWRGDAISRYFEVNQSTAIPEAFKMVEVQAPRVAMALMPGKDWFRLQPVRDKAVEPLAAKALMQEQFADGNLTDRVYRLVQQGAKFGTMIAKVPWRMDRREVTVNQSVTREKYNARGQLIGPEDVTEKKSETINRDRTELRPLSIHDFICDWRYDDPQDAPFNADYSTCTREYVLDMLQAGIKGGGTVYQGITREEVMALGVKDPATQLPGKDIQMRSTNAQMIRKTEENDLRVLDWWGLADPDETGRRQEYHVIILNDTHVVHISKRNLWHGRRPYLVSPWIPVENELYGIGVIQMIVRLCMDLNDNQNAMNAGTALTVNPMVKAGDSFNVPDEQFNVVPGRVMRGGDVKQLQPFILPDMSRVGRENKDDIRRDIDETVGAPRAWVAGTESGDQTATEFSGKMRAANIRIQPAIVRANAMIMQRFLEMSHYNNQQFLDERRTVLYDGNAGQFFRYEVTPAELAGVARVKALLPPQIELLGLRGQMMMNFLNAVATLGPLAAQQPYRAMLKTAYENQFGREGAEMIFPEEATRFRAPQREEILVMCKGVDVDVHEMDNHAMHIQELAAFIGGPSWDDLSPEIQAKVNAHYANHERWFRLQEEEAAQLPSPDAMAGAAMGAAGAATPPAVPEAFGPALEGVLEGRVLGEEARGMQQGT